MPRSRLRRQRPKCGDDEGGQAEAGPLKKVCAATTATVSRHVAAFPQLFVTSSEKAEGIAELRAHLAGMALPKS